MENIPNATPIPAPTKKIFNYRLIIFFQIILIVVMTLATGYFADQSLNLKKQSLSLTPVLNSPQSVIEKTSREMRAEEIQTFQNDFLEMYPHHKQTIDNREIKSISKFWLEKSNQTGWMLDVSSLSDKNYSDRYLALNGELTLLDKNIPVECGFVNTATQVINERVFDQGSTSQTLQDTKFIIFQHGCATGPSLTSLINVDEKRQIPFSDPKNLMQNQLITDHGDVMGKYINQPWHDILAVELSGEPVSLGYAVFELETGKLLKTIEFNNLK